MGTFIESNADLPLVRLCRAAPAVQSSQTSLEAARSLEPEFRTAMQRKVYQFILARGELGATDEECQRGIPMNPSTQRPRRVELADDGLIVRAGKRKTASGRKADVWKVSHGSNDRKLEGRPGWPVNGLP